LFSAKNILIFFISRCLKSATCRYNIYRVEGEEVKSWIESIK
jgi:uncharacterized protein YbbK (DUF523 family)